MDKKRRKCKNNPNLFCYICGKCMLPKQRANITEFVKKTYLTYFGVKLGYQDKPLAPHSECKSCVEHLREWTKGKRKTDLTFGVPMVWREPTNYVNDCYFCMINLAGINSLTFSKLSYPTLPSAIRPAPHSEKIPVPVFYTWKMLTDETSSSSQSSVDTEASEGDYRGPSNPQMPILFD